MFQDFERAFRQSLDPRFRGVLVKSIGLTMAALGGLYFGLVWLGQWLLPAAISLPFIGEIAIGAAIGGVALVAVLAASVFLMFPVAAMCLGFFLEDVVAAVEDRHYPHLPHVTPLGFDAVMRDALRFLAVLVGANLAAFIVYLILPIIAPLVFLAVNGWLLGREYFVMVAARRVGIQRAYELRSQYAGQIWLAGALMALPLSVPVLNIIVPVLGVATFTHMFHRLVGNRPLLGAA